MMLSPADDLIVLVSLTGNQYNIARLRLTNGYCNGKCRSRLKQSGLRDFSNFKAREDGGLKQGEQQGLI